MAASARSQLVSGGRSTLIVVAVATWAVLVAYTNTVTSVTASAEAFEVGIAWETWILSSMSVGLAGALLTVGALGDLWGHRRVFALACAALALTSALAALAPSVLVLVLARALQGAAGAGMLATGLALLGDAFPDGQARTRATALWGAALAAGIASGPILAALAIDAGGWRASHWVMVAIAIAVALAARTLPAVGRRVAGGRIDLPGAVSIVVAMVALTAGITASRDDLASPAALALLAGGLGALALFLLIEARSRAPMLAPELWRRPRFIASIAGASVTGLATIAVMTSVPTFLERSTAISTAGAAGVIAIWPILSVVASTQVHRLPESLGSTPRLVAGLLGSALGTAALGFAVAGSEWWVLAPGLAIAGVGSGVVNASLGRLAVESVPPGSGGLGSGANNTARYLGSAIGIAIVVALVNSGGSGASGLAAGWDHAAWYAGAVNLLGAALVWATRERGSESG